MLSETLKLVLTVIVGAVVNWLAAKIGVVFDLATFNAIVGGIVVWLVSLIGLNFAAQRAPKYFSVK